MATIRFEGRQYPCPEGKTVLDALVDGGATVAYSCRVGQCRSCMLRAVGGVPGPAATEGLKATHRAQGYFLPCVCTPEGDLEVERPGTGDAFIPAEVLSLDRPAKDVARVRLRPNRAFDYRPGQYVSLFRDENWSRPYSLASHPDDDFLELHVRYVAGGALSPWVHDLEPGTVCSVGPATGDSFYVGGHPEQPLLMIGTGTGLAPLYGILRDAIGQGHTGAIHIYHGSREFDGLYLHDELMELAGEYANVSYIPCVSGTGPAPDCRNSRADVAALSDIPQLDGWRLYLCGHPDMVNQTRKRAFLAGAAMGDIHADPFIPARSKEE